MIKFNIRTLRLLTLYIVILSVGVSATIINIPADYPTIQQGIDASTDGDTVLVQPGTYNEGVIFGGHNVTLGSLYLTTGDTSFIAQTEIDWGALFVDGEYNSARITGFTLHGVYGVFSAIYCDSSSPTIDNNIISDAYVIGNGAGIHCDNYASPIITNNLIIDNGTYGSGADGGGIYIGSYCSPLIRENTITGNGTVEDGGGIFCIGASEPVIINNKICNNASGFSGGGIFCASPGAVIAGNEITDNWTGYLGGGILCGGSLPIIISNNTIAGNRASNNLENGVGGGICCWSTHTFILNNVIFGNTADSAGGGIYCPSSHLIIMNNILWADSIGYPNPIEANEIYAYNGSATVEYCDVQGGWPGIGNIDIDPLLRDPASGDFHLMATTCGDSLDSPCIDAGSPYYSDSLLDCSWGLGTSVSDMGAYGGGDSLITAIFDDLLSIPVNFMLLQNYPNPFNAQTTIRFVLPKSQEVELSVYDLLGRQVEVLIDEYRKAGVHNITYDASVHSSGVYFYRLRAGDVVETKRMVLLR